jgi:hypothetical protein
MLMHLVTAQFLDATSLAASDAVKEMTLIVPQTLYVNNPTRPARNPQQTCMLIDPDEDTKRPGPI